MKELQTLMEEKKKVADITDFILKEPLFDNRNGGKDG